MKYILWFFLFALISCDSRNSFEKRISLISLEDKQKLEALFHHMMTGDYFASTLFGNKPMTFQEFHEDPWKLSASTMMNPHSYFYLEEGWKTWMNYQKQFPSHRFLFTKIPSKVGYEFIVLINKTAFRKIFDDNLDVFQQALGPEVIVERIFLDFIEQQKTFSQILNDHEGVVGLVLGYGREASLLAHRDNALSIEILKKSLHPLALPFEGETLPKNIQVYFKWREKRLMQQGVRWHQLSSCDVEQVENLAEEINKCKNASEFFHPTWEELITYILPPNFTCLKNSVETKRLRVEYDQVMKLAREKFREKSFLRGFLEHYCR